MKNRFRSAALPDKTLAGNEGRHRIAWRVRPARLESFRDRICAALRSAGRAALPFCFMRFAVDCTLTATVTVTVAPEDDAGSALARAHCDGMGKKARSQAA
jgi:hypothetical protein